MEIKVTVFKPSGKYYTTETVTVPADVKEMWNIAEWLEANVTGYKGMTLVAMMEEYEHGVPIMIPGDRR